MQHELYSQHTGLQSAQQQQQIPGRCCIRTSPNKCNRHAACSFDSPDAFDTPALLECLEQLKAGRHCEVPTYDFTQHRRGSETRKVSGCSCWRRFEAV